MNPKEFFDTVVEMRKYQRQYFRSKGKDSAALTGAKQLERKVDEEIARVDLLMKEKQAPRLDFNQ